MDAVYLAPRSGHSDVTFVATAPIVVQASSLLPRRRQAGSMNRKGACNRPCTWRTPFRGAESLASEMLIWQLADSAFPSGGFAHSGGLESSWQQGLVNADSLPCWMEAQIVQSARGTLPFVIAAHREPGQYRAIDADCDAFLNNHVANRASRSQGQSLGDTAARTLPVADLTRFRNEARSSAMHLPAVFGVICRLLDVSLEQTARLYLFIALRGWVSAAVRLGIVGPMEGQSIQAKLLSTAEHSAATSLISSCDDAAQTSPIVDMLLAGHDRLYSRLFQS